MTQKYLGPDFAKWTDQWAKAQADGVFADAPKPPSCGEQSGPNDFFGNHRPGEKSQLKDVDAEYWRQVYNLSNNQSDAPDVLAEATKKKDSCGEPVKPADAKDETGKKAKVIGQDPNPQMASTIGRDGVDPKEGTTRVSPGWAASDEQFFKLEDLKKKLYDLECKMHDQEGLSESKVKNLSSKLTSINKQIDELSNDLSPKYGTDHLS